MKQINKALVALCLAAIMACAMIPTVAAEKAPATEKAMVASANIEDDGSKAYTLVWKYKEQGGHLYKRRWNETLGTWYDPAWILVY